ncbi:MAG TPA: hypothetical protein VF234_06205 [Limnochordia bacterium]
MSALSAEAEPYTWTSVPIGGGGYVTGLVIHPAVPDLIYIRTDVGGAYRWDPGGDRWIPLLDMFGRDLRAYYNVDAIAVDPRDPDVVYVAVGRTVGGPSAVLRSQDRGRSWQKTSISVGIYGNADFRWAGPRLSVDPHSGTVLFATRDAGLWRSKDGYRFARVSSFPAEGTGSGRVRDGVDAVGLTFAVWDPSAGTGSSGVSRGIYVGVFGDDAPSEQMGGIYFSGDGGSTWQRLPNSPAKPIRAAVDQAGHLYATHTEGVVKCTPRGCQEIAPVPGAYSGVSVDRHDPDMVVVARRQEGFGNAIYLSSNGGASWEQLSVSPARRTAQPPWWPDTYFASATATLTLDPHRRGRAWLTDWFGVWSTDDITDPEGFWRAHERGHEEVVVQALTSPPAGPPLISGVADVAGFVHPGSLDRFPLRSERLPSDRRSGGVQDVNGIAFYEHDGRYLYLVGNIRSQPRGRAFRSTDGGASWQVIDPVTIPSLPDDTRGGRIAVSGIDPNRIVWLPLQKPPYFSADGGRTWQPATGLPSTPFVTDVWNPSIYLASNTHGSEMFYLYKPRIGLFRSRDGVHFERARAQGLPPSRARFSTIRAVPGAQGEIWISLDEEGLYRSTDAGDTFARVPGVQQALLFDFGKGRPEATTPAVYVYGRANQHPEEGVYRSDDGGTTWVRINPSDLLFGSGPRALAADRQVYGRVYIGTSGRGIFVGAPAGAGRR